MVSEIFKQKIKLSSLRAYEIAQLAGVHPTTLSRIINGIDRVEAGDKRVIAIGRIVGLKEEECFARKEQSPPPDGKRT